MHQTNIPPSKSVKRPLSQSWPILKVALWPTQSIDSKIPGPLFRLATRLQPLGSTLVQSLIANLEMAGLLIDGLTRWRRFVLLSVVVSMVADYYTRPFVSVATTTWLAVGLFTVRQLFLLASFIPNGVADRLKAHLGEESGGRAYEGLTALFFYHRSYSYVLLVQKTAFLDANWLVPYLPYLQGFGWLFIATGLLVNTGAFFSIGRPAFYYLDMYYGRFLQPFSDRGIYRLLKNPMYSVGQLPAYGVALLYGSWPGILYAVANQVCCYVFYAVAERPHIKTVLTRRKDAVSPSC